LGEYTGLLSNLCEGGLAVKSRIPEILGEVFSLSVELPNRSSTMQALAQITWKSDLENLTGVQFVHLSDTSRQQVREWMFTQATTTVKELPPIFRVSARNAQLNFAAFHSQLTSGVEPNELEVSRRHAGLHLLTALVLTAATLWTASFTVGLYLGRRSEYQRTRTLAPAATTVDHHTSSQVETAQLSSAKNPLPSVAPLTEPGFVLQVGAMTFESNADALSETLQRNGFPAVVFKRVNEHFYKVVVGPFPDIDSAVEVKRKIEKQGIKAVLQPWSPD
jgi:hypothetical protein